MPDKDITYKISIDEGDLSQRLADIRNEIDAALTIPTYKAGDYGNVLAGSGAGAIYPSAFSTLDQTFSNTIDAAKIDMWQSQQASAFGFNKISDLFDQGYATAANTLNLLPSRPDAGFTGNEGWFRAAIGVAGVGYDPKSVLNRTEYREAMRHRMAYTAPDAFGAVLGGTIGFAAGSAISAGALGVIGGVVGGFVGEKVIGGGLNLLYGPAIQDMQTADYVDYSLKGTLGYGQMGQGFGTRVAGRMREFSRSREAIMDRLGRTEIEELFSQFTDMGGFSTARTSEDYMRRFDDMLEGHRKVMHALRVSSEKALQFMATLETTNLIGTRPDQFSSYAAGAQIIRAAGETVGLPAGQIAQYGLQSQQLGTQSMPGLTFAGTFMEGMSSLMRTQQLARAGLYDNELLAQLGGVTGISSALQGVGYSYARTPMGRLALQLGPENLIGGTEGTFNMITRSMDRFNTVEDFIRFKSGVDMPGQMEKMGTDKMIDVMVLQALNLLETMPEGDLKRTPEGKLDMQTVMGMTQIIAQQQGMNIDNNLLKATILSRLGPRQPSGEMRGELLENLLKQQMAERPTQIQELLTTVKQRWGTVQEDLLRPLGAGAALALPAAAVGSAFGPAGAIIAGGAVLAGVPIYTAIRGRRGMERDYNAVVQALMNLGTTPNQEFDIGAISQLAAPKAEYENIDVVRKELLALEIKENGRAGIPMGGMFGIDFGGGRVYPDQRSSVTYPTPGGLYHGDRTESEVILKRAEEEQAKISKLIRNQIDYMEDSPIYGPKLRKIYGDRINTDAIVKGYLTGVDTSKQYKEFLSLLRESTEGEETSLTKEALDRYTARYKTLSAVELGEVSKTEGLKFLEDIGLEGDLTRTLKSEGVKGLATKLMTKNITPSGEHLKEQKLFRNLVAGKDLNELVTSLTSTFILKGEPINRLEAVEYVDTMIKRTNEDSIATHFLRNIELPADFRDPAARKKFVEDVEQVGIFSMSERAAAASTAMSSIGIKRNTDAMKTTLEEILSKSRYG